MQHNYYLGFSEFSGIGPKRFLNLSNAFGSVESAWNASEENLRPILGNVFTQKFIAFRKTFSFDLLEEKLVSLGVSLLTVGDEAYPSLLRLIPFPPYLLYVRGNKALLQSKKMIAVVGTRKISAYGTEVTTTITRDLVKEGFVIVSGLAFGVDAVAHATSLQNHGSTIAVLGCGVDCCYPVQNQRIYQDILENGGAIISTFRIGENPNRGSFPARNGIIAGISQGVVVTEGAEDSGSLITANYAVKYQRPVFAVPGPITSYLSKGTNKLLQSGAIVVTNARDVMDVISNPIISGEKSMSQNGELSVSPRDDIMYSQEEREIIDILQYGPLKFDEIVRKIGRSAKEIASRLSMMELKGIINNRTGEYSMPLSA